ncbi:MAG TPA: HD domain-containing protein, partial [Acidimicrobiales bacterium]
MAAVDRVLPWRRGSSTASAEPGELREVLGAYRTRHPKAPTALIVHAYEVAKEAHREQRRVSGDPYIQHPLAVAAILADLGLDDITIAAALLHDAVEDTGVSVDDVV